MNVNKLFNKYLAAGAAASMLWNLSAKQPAIATQPENQTQQAAQYETQKHDIEFSKLVVPRPNTIVPEEPYDSVHFSDVYKSVIFPKEFNSRIKPSTIEDWKPAIESRLSYETGIKNKIIQLHRLNPSDDVLTYILGHAAAIEANLTPNFKVDPEACVGIDTNTGKSLSCLQKSMPGNKIFMNPNNDSIDMRNIRLQDIATIDGSGHIGPVSVNAYGPETLTLSLIMDTGYRFDISSVSIIPQPDRHHTEIAFFYPNDRELGPHAFEYSKIYEEIIRKTFEGTPVDVTVIRQLYSLVGVMPNDTDLSKKIEKYFRPDIDTGIDFCIYMVPVGNSLDKSSWGGGRRVIIPITEKCLEVNFAYELWLNNSRSYLPVNLDLVAELGKRYYHDHYLFAGHDPSPFLPAVLSAQENILNLDPSEVNYRLNHQPDEYDHPNRLVYAVANLFNRMNQPSNSSLQIVSIEDLISEQNYQQHVREFDTLPERQRLTTVYKAITNFKPTGNSAIDNGVIDSEYVFEKLKERGVLTRLSNDKYTVTDLIQRFEQYGVQDPIFRHYAFGEK